MISIPILWGLVLSHKHLSKLLRSLRWSLAPASGLWLPRRAGKVPQQPGKGLLIHVMRLPALKVANVPGIADQRRPACLQGHYRVVDPDRKENGRALLAFP